MIYGSQLRRQSTSDNRVNLDNFNRLMAKVDAMEHAFMPGQFTVHRIGTKTVVGAARQVTGPSIFSLFAWGHSISGPTVTFQGGYFIVIGYGTYEVAPAAVTVAGGTSAVPHYVLLRATKATPSDAAILTTSQAGAPNNNGTHYEIPLAKVYRSTDGLSAVVKYPRSCIGCPIIIGATL